MAGRAVLLLLAFLLSFGVVQLVQVLLFGFVSLLPGTLATFAALGGLLAVTAVQFFLAGFLFTLAAGMPWKLSGLWTWAGIGLCNLLSGGRPGFTLLGAAFALAAGAAAFWGCLLAERREDEPWAQQGRAMLLGFFNRG